MVGKDECGCVMMSCAFVLGLRQISGPLPAGKPHLRVCVDVQAWGRVDEWCSMILQPSGPLR
jgi:hypothetical protein